MLYYNMLNVLGEKYRNKKNNSIEECDEISNRMVRVPVTEVNFGGGKKQNSFRYHGKEHSWQRKQQLQRP